MPSTTPKKNKSARRANRARKSTGAAPSRKVRVRTYRHGLGDCHLLTFSKPDGSHFNILIDCGVVNRTRNPGPLMTDVARDIAKESHRVLDLVVATHQHTDHLSGFKQAAEEFEPGKITMKRLWLAWTEDPQNPLGKRIQRQLVKKLAAVRQAAAKLTALNHEAAARIQGVLDFFGPGGQTQAILDKLQERLDTQVTYYNPGDVFPLPEVPGVRVYVLGPPTDPAYLKVTGPRKSKREGYEEADLAADAAGFVDAILPELGEGNVELSYPFERRHRRDSAQMQNDAFFKEHYFGVDADNGEDQTWRQIDTAWLEVAEQIALAVNDITNNTSLALAFEFIESGEVLLFPGDAQIGSWLTWQNLLWKVTDGKGLERDVSIGDLFSRTVFYKASHHASHNGTLSGLGLGVVGLEQMTHRDLISVVPVDRDMAKEMSWDRTLPWKPLLDRLAEKTRGRLVLTDRKESPPDPAKLANLSNVERQRFKQQIVVSPYFVDYSL